MHSASTLAVMSALAGSALAQSTTVASLYLYGFEGDNLVASVVAAAPEATTYFVGCAPGTDSTECGFGPGLNFIEGPSTLGLHFTEADAFTLDVDCAVESQTATCVETDAGPEANDPGMVTAVLSDMSDSLVPVTITAGLDLLAAAASGSSGSGTVTRTTEETTTTAASTGASATETSATKTSTRESSSSTAGSKTSSATQSATSTDAANGAASMAGRNAVLAGVAGVFGMAMAL